VSLFRPLTNPFWILADILQLVILLILADVLVSWMMLLRVRGVTPYAFWVKTLRALTDPILRPFRLLMPPYKLRGIDVSPVLAIVLINLVIGFLDHAGRRAAGGG